MRWQRESNDPSLKQVSNKRSSSSKEGEDLSLLNSSESNLKIKSSTLHGHWNVRWTKNEKGKTIQLLPATSAALVGYVDDDKCQTRDLRSP